MIFFLIVNVFIESIVFKFYFKARNLKFCCVQYPNFFIYIYIYKGKRKRYLWEIVQLSKIFRFLVQSSPNHLIVYISTARLQQYIYNHRIFTSVLTFSFVYLLRFFWCFFDCIIFLWLFIFWLCLYIMNVSFPFFFLGSNNFYDDFFFSLSLSYLYIIEIVFVTLPLHVFILLLSMVYISFLSISV